MITQQAKVLQHLIYSVHIDCACTYKYYVHGKVGIEVTDSFYVSEPQHYVYRWCARQVVCILFPMRANAHETAALLPHKKKTLSWWYQTKQSLDSGCFKLISSHQQGIQVTCLMYIHVVCNKYKACNRPIYQMPQLLFNHITSSGQYVLQYQLHQELQ